MTLAQSTGLPIFPYSCQLGWKIQVRSWDCFQIPLPFSHCAMTFGEPIHVPRDATSTERERLGTQLQSVLLAGTQSEEGKNKPWFCRFTKLASSLGCGLENTNQT